MSMKIIRFDDEYNIHMHSSECEESECDLDMDLLSILYWSHASRPKRSGLHRL